MALEVMPQLAGIESREDAGEAELLMPDIDSRITHD